MSIFKWPACVLLVTGLGILPGHEHSVVQPKAASRIDTRAIPDPSSLSSNWWDYLAPDRPGLSERATALLQRAQDVAAGLPSSEQANAGLLLQRLKSSLTALPAHLAQTTPPLATARARQNSYTLADLIDVDRDLRQTERTVETLRNEIAQTSRVLADDQRELDTRFAAYLQLQPANPQRIIAGLDIMARQSELALAQIDHSAQQGRLDASTTEAKAIADLKAWIVPHLGPDPQRTPQLLSALRATADEQASRERVTLVRLRTERAAMVDDSEDSRLRAVLVDQEIGAAALREAQFLIATARYDSETDWLSIWKRDMDPEAANALASRLKDREAFIDTLEGEAHYWMQEGERVVINGVSGESAPADRTAAALRDETSKAASNTIALSQGLIATIDDVRLLTLAALNQLVKTQGFLGRVWIDLETPASDLWRRSDAFMSSAIFRLSGTPVTPYGLLQVAVVLVAALGLSRVLQSLLARLGRRRAARSAAAFYTVGRLLHYLLVAAGLVIGLSSIGLDLSQLALLAGALSIGIGFGLQSIVNNFVSGLIILFEQNLKVGDFVELGSGVRGTVRDINVRSTLLTTSDNIDIVVPNSEFITANVTNYTLRDPYHRVHIPFSVAYGSDKDQVRQIIIDVAKAIPYTLFAETTREPDVWLVKLGASSMDFELVVWINPAAVSRPGVVMAAYLWEIESSLRSHGIEIPFPQRDVRMRPPAAPAPVAVS